MASEMVEDAPGPSRRRETSMKVMAKLSSDFPDAESLSRHAQIHARLQLEILDVKDEIDVLEAELKRDQDPAKMSRIQSQIGRAAKDVSPRLSELTEQQLMLQINVIREKAAEAEAIVLAITTDVQKLDIAKRNLTGAIKTLERWDMLKQAHRQLSELLPSKRYREIAQALAAVTQLLVPLKPSSAVMEVAEVFKAAEEDRKQVQEKVAAEMDVYFRQDPNHPPDHNLVKEVCQVIDVLAGDFRNHIIERYLQLQLAEYRRIFRSTDEAGQLDNVPRRYAWFRRILKHFDDEDADLFPLSWEIGRMLVADFAEYTKADLVNVLGKQAPGVGSLLEALQSTLDFEGTISKRFEIPFDELVGKGGTMRTTSPGKWTISSVFDAYFGVYVDAQDRAIADVLSQYRGARSRSSMEGVMQQESEPAGPTVLPSSTELFYFYGQTLDQCQKYTTGDPMKRLAKVFAKWLKVYSDEVLLAGMKKVDPGPRRSLEGKANLQEIKTACMILNTAEYCQNTSTQLEERVKDKISESLKEEVSFQSERETFASVTAACIANILRELETHCEPAFTAITRSPWAHLDNVSGRSAYVVDLVGSIKQVAEIVRTRVEAKKYIRNFADKAVGVIMKRYTQAVIKSRPLKQIGAEQILIDAQALKACLLDLPEPHPENSSNAYTKYVTKNIGQLETMLKVVMAPDDPPEGFVHNYCLLIGDRSFTNFQKILDLKGTPRNEQQKLVDTYLSITSTKDDLADTSFLTSLDMDPHPAQAPDRLVTSPSASNLFSPPSSHLFSPTGGAGNVLPNLLRAGSADAGDGNREGKAFGELRRFVSFATRRD